MIRFHSSTGAIVVALMCIATASHAVTLHHRYSFTSDASDSVGTADLTLQGGASISGNALDTSNANGGARNDGAFAQGAALAQLASTINSNSAITMEAWYTQDQVNNWSKIMMVGLDTNNYMDITPTRSSNGPSSISMKHTPNGENNVQTGAQISNGVNYYVAGTWDTTTNTMTIRSGQVGGTLNTFTAGMGGQQLNSVAINQFYLGSAVGFGDPDFDGKIDEFRISSGALSNSQAAVNFASGPDTVNSSPLVGLYRFENAGNLGQDSSTLGNQLLNNGNVAHSGAGQFGGALSLDGNGDFLSQGAQFPTAVPTGGDGYAIAAWFKPDAATNPLGSQNGIVGWGNYGTSREVNAIRMNGPDGFRHYWWGADLDTGDGGADLFDGNYHHIVVMYDPATDVRSLLLNGVLMGSDNPGFHNALALNFAIGKTVGNEFFDGMLDDVAIFNRALTQNEIDAIRRGDFSAFFAPTVPEPATGLLTLMAIGVMGRRRRRTA